MKNVKIISALLFTVIANLNVIAQVDVIELETGTTLEPFKRAQLNDSIVGQIFMLIKERDNKLRLFDEFLKEQSEAEVIVFRDEKYEPIHIQNNFRKKLSKIISIEEFGKIFQSQLEYRITRITEEKLEEADERYFLNGSQRDSLERLIYDNTVSEVITREYYGHDEDLAWNNYLLEKLESEDKLCNLVNKFGLLCTLNSKTDTLIAKAKKAGIDNNRISKILAAIQKRNRDFEIRLKNWRQDDSKHPVYFYDEGAGEHAIRMTLRKKLKEILSFEEFSILFLEQMENRIERDSEQELLRLTDGGYFTKHQLVSLRDIVNKKNQEKILTEEYFKYDYDTYQQKLRSVEYRYEKKLRALFNRFIDENKGRTKG